MTYLCHSYFEKLIIVINLYLYCENTSLRSIGSCAPNGFRWIDVFGKYKKNRLKK